jgi:hypothetical protein
MNKNTISRVLEYLKHYIAPCPGFLKKWEGEKYGWLKYKTLVLTFPRFQPPSKMKSSSSSDLNLVLYQKGEEMVN